MTDPLAPADGKQSRCEVCKDSVESGWSSEARGLELRLAASPSLFSNAAQPIPPAFMSDQNEEGKPRRLPTTSRESSERSTYRRALSHWQLTDEEPKYFIDPQLPLGSAVFNNLAFQCVMSKQETWVMFIIYSVVVVFANVQNSIRLIVTFPCRDLVSATHAYKQQQQPLIGCPRYHGPG